MTTTATAIAPLTETPLATLAEEITALHDQVAATEQAALSQYYALGQMLAQVKQQLDHGHWLPWLQEHGINDRRAQRAVKVFSEWGKLELKSANVSSLTLTEALDIITDKKPKGAGKDQPQTKNVLSDPKSDQEDALPTQDAAQGIQDQNGVVEPPESANEFDEFEMSAIAPPVTCWFDQGATAPMWVEGVAVAKNKRFIRVEWGTDRQRDVTRGKVRWTNPVEIAEDAPTADTTPQQILSSGLVEGDRATGSHWLPEEAAHSARIQFAGLLRFMSPEEFLQAAIAHYAEAKGWHESNQLNEIVDGIIDSLKMRF